ncbi:MAG TPA: protein kinase [Terriglobales bacterium]|nr:protein kinase [Terriglobales bacterium]
MDVAVMREIRACAAGLALGIVALLATATSARAQLAYGQLTITSDPPGATVTIDGEQMEGEFTPWGPAELPEGHHIISLRHPQFTAPQVLKVTIRSGAPAKVHARFTVPVPPAVGEPRLPPVSPPVQTKAPVRTGGLQIESIPSGAKVFLEGERRGTTPVELQALREGVYAVRLEADGFPARTTSVQVVAGKTIATVVPLNHEKRRTNSGWIDPRTLVWVLGGLGVTLSVVIVLVWRRSPRAVGTGWSNDDDDRLIVGDYVVDRTDVIAEGGMCTLYRGHPRNGRRETVAVKIPHGQYQRDPEFIAAFKHEGALGRELHNENIIKIYDSDTTPGGLAYIVMEYVEGVDLNKQIANGLSLQDAVEIATQIARALDYAHSKQVVHCDIKPGNVLARAGRPPRVVLTDFGIARAGHQTNPSGDVITGTPDYMAPEVIMRRPPSPGSDLYALGVVLFEMLARRKPFDAPNNDPNKIMDMHLGYAPPSVSAINPKVPRALEAIVMRLLAKAPEQRYPSAAALINDLQAFARMYAATA